MRKPITILSVLLLAACSSGSGGSSEEPPVAACSVEGQKQFVLDNMRAWYFWNELLPAQVDLSQFGTPEDLLAFLTMFSPDITPDDGIDNPVDRFSFINTAAADQAFFGEGKFEGFGFSSRFVAENDLRLTRVFLDSPANRADPGPLARGQRIVALNGRTIAEIQAAEGVNAVFDQSPLDFTMRPVGGNPDGSDDFTTTITQDIVTIDPVPQARIITDPNGVRPPIGYMELATFISTADAEMDAVFADFRAQGVNDAILDFRYNGGGLVSTSELLGDFLGGDVAENLVYSKTVFNALRAAANDSIEFFERRANSMSLVRLVVIASRSTASASELVINGMEPHVEVAIVGDDTFGKPVGQVGLEFCEKILRPTAFQTLNANDFGDYFFGLPVDCAAPDDLNVAVGADDDPNIEAALSYLQTGACPPSALPGAQFKLQAEQAVPQLELRGTPARQFANAL
jgi:C-terminal processing protease CtpA/Prc